jgi:hypothetical protein
MRAIGSSTSFSLINLVILGSRNPEVYSEAAKNNIECVSL